MVHTVKTRLKRVRLVKDNKPKDGRRESTDNEIRDAYFRWLADVHKKRSLIGDHMTTVLRYQLMKQIFMRKCFSTTHKPFFAGESLLITRLDQLEPARLFEDDDDRLILLHNIIKSSVDMLRKEQVYRSSQQYLDPESPEFACNVDDWFYMEWLVYNHIFEKSGPYQWNEMNNVINFFRYYDAFKDVCREWDPNFLEKALLVLVKSSIKQLDEVQKYFNKEKSEFDKEWQILHEKTFEHMVNQYEKKLEAFHLRRMLFNAHLMFSLNPHNAAVPA